jgi:hypothetical protein
MADFQTALGQLTPSLPMEELQRYKRLQQSFQMGH